MDTSCSTAMAAVSENTRVLASVSICDGKTHSVKLLPAIEYVLKASDTRNEDICAVAVTNGPGSYTGLRIGVTTAKTYGYTLNVPVIGIDSLEALALSCVTSSDAAVCPVIDARNARVYAALYIGGRKVMASEAISCDELCDRLIKDHKGERIVFTGDGVASNKELFCGKLGEMFVPAPEQLSNGSPTALSLSAYRKYKAACERGDLSDMAPSRLKIDYYKKYTDDI